MAIETPPTAPGTPLVDAALPDLTGTTIDLASYADGRPLLVAFVCNHCPYVKHVERVFGQVAAELIDAGLAVVAVCSNDAERYPDDAPEQLAAQAERAGWGFPYLIDADQSLALATGAVCTPDLFLYDAAGRLAYRGAFDGSTPGNGVELTGADLRAAAEAVLAGRPAPDDQRPSMGCGIKWRPGNEPG